MCNKTRERIEWTSFHLSFFRFMYFYTIDGIIDSVTSVFMYVSVCVFVSPHPSRPYTFPPVSVCLSAAESECRYARVRVCKYFSSGSAESDDPRLPAQRRGEEVGAASSGQQPDGQRDGNRSAPVCTHFHTHYSGHWWQFITLELWLTCYHHKTSVNFTILRR